MTHIKYYDLKYPSNSSLVKLLQGKPQECYNNIFGEKNDEDILNMSDYFKYGSVVDYLITKHDGEEEPFIVIEEDVSNEIKKLFIELTINYTITNVPTVDEMMSLLSNTNTYYGNQKEKTRYDKIKDYIHLLPVYQEALLNQKFIIDSQTYTKASKRVSEIVNDPLFTNLKSFESEVLFQKPLFMEINNIKYKGLLDMLIIDNDKINIVDIKTTSKSIHDFVRDLRKRDVDNYMYGYITQQIMYKELVLHNYDTNYKTITNYIFVLNDYDRALIEINPLADDLFIFNNLLYEYEERMKLNDFVTYRECLGDNKKIIKYEI